MPFPLERSEPGAGPPMGRREGEHADPSAEAWVAARRGRPCGISRIRNSFDSVRVFIEVTANFDQQPPPRDFYLSPLSLLVYAAINSERVS